MGLPMGQKLVTFATNCVQPLRNAYIWNRGMDLPHLKFVDLSRPVVRRDGYMPMGQKLAKSGRTWARWFCGTHISETHRKSPGMCKYCHSPNTCNGSLIDASTSDTKYEWGMWNIAASTISHHMAAMASQITVHSTIYSTTYSPCWG